MTPINVLVYDDQSEIADLWARKIEGAYSEASVKRVEKEGFTQLIELVQSRRNGWRPDGDSSRWAEQHEADAADVIVVDYDL